MVILEFDPPARTVGTGTERFRRSQRRRMQPLTWVGDPSACALLSARTLGAKEGLGALSVPGPPRAGLVASPAAPWALIWVVAAALLTARAWLPLLAIALGM